MNDLDIRKKVEGFHKSRIMFAIKNDILYIHKETTEMSHYEWFKELGWITDNNEESIINEVLRGYVDSEGVYFYRGFEYEASEDDVKLFIRNILCLDDRIGIDGNLPVFAGVIKGEIGEKFKPKKFIGSAYNMAYYGTYIWD